MTSKKYGVYVKFILSNTVYLNLKTLFQDMTSYSLDNGSTKNDTSNEPNGSSSA